MKRILFVDPVGEKGGAEVVLRDIVCGLDRSRYEPLVACLKPGPFVEELRALGIPVFALRAHKTRQLHHVAAAVLQLSSIIQRERIDLVHGNGCTMLFYGGLASHLRGRACVWHVYDPLKGTGAFEAAFIAAQRRLRPRWTIFGTPAVAESYVATYKNLKRYSTILPGVDVEQVTRGAEAGRARERWQIPGDSPIIAMFARMQRTKGHQDLIEAAERVVADYPSARFVLCGGTLFGLEAEYPQELCRQIQGRGLEGRVLLTGFVSDEEKRDILAAATIVAHPAHSEPFGLAVVEGMAAGKPVVATDCIGPTLTVQHGETGWITPRGDVLALADALCSLLGNPVQAQTMGKRGRLRVQELFSVDAMVNQVEAIYESVLGGAA